ncbi:CopD family protein [Azospirillum sp. YIM B02556]|uniref:Protoporphyrinogen IX oxidase n=1 Tax=Azospirillum endophyticum TaxID=2800326 RepID=A0ABS1EYM1_9PROT|nr:CopD family protein [Azospirillum endophyticum]MBK1836250.1 CopD family protein [Azospirillum endophyticum]
MIYLWLKAFHIASVTVWIGGMFVAAIAVAALSASKSLPDAPNRADIIEAVRRWDRWATSPAMLLAWLFGLAVATEGGWFGARWLMMKLVFVVALSGLHGMLSGTLRKLARTAEQPSPASGHALPVIVGAVVVIVLLVVLKPI